MKAAAAAMPTPINRLPVWQDLLAQTLNRANVQHPVRVHGNTLKATYSIFFAWAARFLVRRLTDDPAFLKYCELSWDDIFDILLEQAALNHHARQIEPRSSLKLVTHGTSLKRSYCQLPCNLETLEKRTQIAKSIIHKDAKILLLGDDDLLSVTLARNGFTDIHVFDIDPDLLARIATTAQEESLPITTRRVDFLRPIDTGLVDDYALVFMDPFYTVDGIHIFLKAAEFLTQHSPRAKYFLSVHLMSLGSQGVKTLQETLTQRHLHITEFFPNFNCYPLPFFMRALIALGNSVIAKTIRLQAYAGFFPLFFSDGALLEKQ